MGIGWIIRDENGVFKKARSAPFFGIYLPSEAKAMGLKEVLSWLNLAAKFAGDAESGIGHVEEDAVVLLLHVGDDVEDGVDVVGRGGHGQAGGAPGRAVDQEVVLRQRHVHPLEHESDGGHRDGHRVARGLAGGAQSERAGEVGGLEAGFPAIVETPKLIDLKARDDNSTYQMALRGSTADVLESGGLGRREVGGGRATGAAGTGNPGGVAAGVHGQKQGLGRGPNLGPHNVGGALHHLPPGGDGHGGFAGHEAAQVLEPRLVFGLHLKHAFFP
nr:hypothetical protein GOBAR_AA11473 [Ipomoea batatas]